MGEGAGMSRTPVRNFNAERFEDLRTKKGLTYAALARRSGVGSSSIRKWEKGLVSPSLEALVVVMDAMGHLPHEVIDVPLDEATLSDLRARAMCPREEVAEALGISPSGYARLERGEVALSGYRTSVIATLFGVDELTISTAWGRARDRNR